jgi:predicted kinase
VSLRQERVIKILLVEDENIKTKKSELCRRCGNCCRGMALEVSKYNSNPMYNSSLLEWSSARGGRLLEERSDNYLIYIPYTCPQLQENDNGTVQCKIYENRPLACKEFDGIKHDVYKIVDCKWKYLNEDLTELGNITEFKEDLMKQFVVLMGLPASGKSYFVKTELRKYFPGAPSFNVVNSDAQVRQFQYVLAEEHFDYLKNKVLTEEDMQKFIDDTQYISNDGKAIKFPLGFNDVKKIKNMKDFWKKTQKEYYAAYFDIRDVAKEETQKIFEDKIHTAAGMIVVDTVAAKPNVIFQKLREARSKEFVTTIIYLDINPELCIVRDAWRGKHSGRTVGEPVISNYAKNMESVLETYEKEGEKKDGLIDRIIHFTWEPQEGDPIKGTWSEISDVKYYLKRKKKYKEV